MRLYGIVWKERTGLDNSRERLDNKVFKTSGDAVSYIKSKGLKQHNILGWKKDNLSADVKELSLVEGGI